MTHYNPLHDMTASGTEVGGAATLQNTRQTAAPPASSQLPGQTAGNTLKQHTLGTLSEVDGNTAYAGSSTL